MKNEREPEKQKMKRLGAKNMDLVQGNRRKDERIIEQQEEILSLVKIDESTDWFRKFADAFMVYINQAMI